MAPENKLPAPDVMVSGVELLISRLLRIDGSLPSDRELASSTLYHDLLNIGISLRQDLGREGFAAFKRRVGEPMSAHLSHLWAGLEDWPDNWPGKSGRRLRSALGKMGRPVTH